VGSESRHPVGDNAGESSSERAQVTANKPIKFITFAFLK